MPIASREFIPHEAGAVGSQLVQRRVHALGQSAVRKVRRHGVNRLDPHLRIGIAQRGDDVRLREIALTGEDARKAVSRPSGERDFATKSRSIGATE